MSPLRRKARGGAGARICSLPPPISPPVSALRKLFEPSDLLDHPMKPSVPCARRVPIDPKLKKQQKNAPLSTSQSHRHPPSSSFKMPCHVGSGYPTATITSRKKGCAAETFHAEGPINKSPRAAVVSNHIRKSDAAKARSSKALASCELQIRTLEEGSEKQWTTTRRHVLEHGNDKKDVYAVQMSPTSEAGKVGLNKTGFDTKPSFGLMRYMEDGDRLVNLQENTTPIWHRKPSPSMFESNDNEEWVSLQCSFHEVVLHDLFYNQGNDVIDLSPHKEKPTSICNGAISVNESLDTDRSLDASQRSILPRNLAIFDSCSSDAIHGIFKPQLQTSFQELDGINCGGNAGQNLSNRWVDNGPCSFDSQGIDIQQESDSSRCCGYARKKLGSCSDQTMLGSRWSDVDVYGFASHSHAERQAVDNVRNSEDVCWNKDARLSGTLLQGKLALLEDRASYIAATLKKTSNQLDAKILEHVVLLSCIQSKLANIEELLPKLRTSIGMI